MSYLTQKTYALERPILFNNDISNNLFGTQIKADKVSRTGGCKKIQAGSFITTEGRLLDRAVVIAKYTSGQPGVIVNNPWAFLPGDILYVIGDETENYVAEKTAVEQGTAPIFGTVTAVNLGVNLFQATIVPSGVTVGSTYTLQIEEVVVSYTAKTTVVSDLLKGLQDELLAYSQQAEHSTIQGITITNNNANLVIKAKELGQLFKVKADVSGSGNLAIAIPFSLGALNITPSAGNATLEVGSKIGSIDKQAIGIIAKTLYLTDQDNQERPSDCAAYDMANINKRALPYLDGALVAANQTLKYLPPYGQ